MEEVTKVQVIASLSRSSLPCVAGNGDTSLSRMAVTFRPSAHHAVRRTSDKSQLDNDSQPQLSLRNMPLPGQAVTVCYMGLLAPS